MGKTENIFEKTARLLKENDLTLDILTPEVIEEIQGMTKSHTDISVTNLTEQVDPEDYGIIDGTKGKEDGDNYNEDYVDNSPFTKLEVSILNQLHREFNRDELRAISDETPGSYGVGQKFWKILKIFGIPFKNDSAHQTRMSKYAKWALDNWTEEGDYGSIEAPIKVPLKWYDIDRSESGSQIEYRDGTAEVLGFDEDDASERADLEWYDWGGEMETTDYGDYETYDSNIESVNFLRVDENKNPLKESDLRTKALISIGGIQRDKVTTPIFIKNIFNSSGHEAKSSGVEPEDGGEWNRFYTPGTNIDLDSDLQRVRDRIRFEEYGEMFQQGIEGRGFAFEGMLAGLFNGEPMEAGGKEDIKVGDDYYSIKQSNPGDAWDTGSLMEGYGWAKKSMEDDGFAEEEIPPTPLDLMIAGDDYRPYKAEMLIESFKSSNGKPLKWIFAHVLDAKHIRYVSMDSDELISALLSSDCSDGTGSQKCAVGKSRKKDTGLRIKSRFVLGADPKMITFPSVSDEDMRSIIYDPDGDRIEDKIRRIFKNPNKVSQYTVEYIRDNPQEFLAAVNKEVPNLTTEEKKLAYDLLMEESDVFGQGLLDPIEPEEFEGTEEEWEKMMADVEEEGEDYDYEDDIEIYTGGTTDPERGFVAPSKEVTTNVCRVEGFCQEQGPITFGQLKALVEAATRKRIQADMGRGVFKMLWRIIPFFVPQILLAAVGVTATRAFNKIITPALTDTRGYKEWWGKAVLKAMDIAEGDYIPDITMGDDPLSKVFFISDGLMSMIKDKYKLKFARYVADYAAARPADEPVPDWFVENLLRDYLNQKFLLDPPLPVKIDIEKKPIKESENPFGLLGDNWKDQILKHEKNLTKNELKYKKLADNLDGMNVTIPVDIHDGAEPVIGTTDITFSVVRPFIFQGLRGDFFDNMTPAEGDKIDPTRPTVIKYDLVFRGVEPGSILEELLEENSLEGMHIHNISARERLMELLEEESYNINETLMKNYFKLYGTTIGRLGNIYDSQQLQEQERDNWQKPRKFTDKDLDDSNLNISPETLWEYLDSNHRQKLIREITSSLNCLEYNCYDGWRKDVENEWDEEEAEELAQGYCGECGEELNNHLEEVDVDLGKMGFITPNYTMYNSQQSLQKPFPYSYNVWIDGVVKEINPRFYVDSNEDISYEEEVFGVIRGPLDETIMDEVPLEQFKTENPKVEEILNRFPEDLQRELAVERKNPQEFIEDFGGYHLNSPNPIEIDLKGELNKTHTIDTMSRTPQDVVDVINDKWNTNFESVKVIDPNPDRYFEYAELSPDTAPPSLMVNDEILYGIARFVSALLRGDKTIKVWDITDKGYEDKMEDEDYERGWYAGSLNEQTPQKINPELEEGDTILIVDRRQAPPGVREPFPEHEPELFVSYAVTHKENTGHKAKHPYHYFLLPEEQYEIFLANPYDEGVDKHEKSLFPWIHDWILEKSADSRWADEEEDIITEQEQTKLNPYLMVGDEITVIDVDESWGTLNTPQRFKDYLVIGIKQSNETQETYYEVKPLDGNFGYTDEELIGRILAGGGKVRSHHVYPTDKWILRKGFLRGEHLTEDDSLNDLVYRDEPKDKHIRRMSKDLGSLEGFPIERFKNMPPPENESDTTEEEIAHIENIPMDDDFIHSADDIDIHFKKFLEPKGLEWPGKELKKVIQGVRAIVLRLKYHYNRPRPYQVAQAKGLPLDAETLRSASTPSYPSGHATQGRFIGRYLADLYPEYGEELRQIGDDIAFSRNMAKVHYPSDSEFGKLLGDEMYEYVYQEDMEPALQEQYDMVPPLEAKRRDSTSQLFKILDDNFIIHPHPRGELTYDGKQMALYSYENDMFVPISVLYDSIDGMTEAGLPKEDIGIFIDIVTDWVNSRMVSKPQLYESLIDVNKEEMSPDLEIGDRIYVWDLEPDPQPPGGSGSDSELPSNSIAIVIDGPFTDRDEESYRGGIEYEVRDEMSGEYFGLYGGTPVEDQMSTRFSTEYVPITYEDRDKWILLPKKPLKEHKSFIQKVTRRKIDEALEPEWSIRRGRQHYAMNATPESGEQITAFNDYLVKNSPFNYQGLDYHLSAIPGMMPGSAKVDLFIPQLDKGKDADTIWGPLKDSLDFTNVGNYPATKRYYEEYRNRLREFSNEMEEIGKLFSINSVIINRNINQPWSRTPDSYGNESIRPGTPVPYHTPQIV